MVDTGIFSYTLSISIGLVCRCENKDKNQNNGPFSIL